MTNPVDYIEQHPERTTRIFGVNYQKWNQLVEKARAYSQQQQQKLELTKVRINAPGAGRKPILSEKEEIGLCLFYLRQMPTFEVLGMQFGVSKTEANDTFHKWLLILRKILPASLLEQLENQPQNREMLLSFLEEIEHRSKQRGILHPATFELLVDTTEQPRERPQLYSEQKKFYSGKQKSHTFKNSFVSCSQGKDIIDVVVGVKGPEADKNLLSQQQANFSPSQRFVGDKAYVGASPTVTPAKKPRGGELTTEQKDKNRRISKQRIFIEHLIRRLKIFRIAGSKFRLNPQNYPLAIYTICGLVRLRLGTNSCFP